MLGGVFALDDVKAVDCVVMTMTNDGFDQDRHQAVPGCMWTIDGHQNIPQSRATVEKRQTRK